MQREVGKGRGFAKRARVGSACIGRCEGAAARASARVPPALGRAAAAGRRHRAMKGDSEAMSLLASPSRSATSPPCQSRGRLLPPPHPRHRVCRAPCGCAASRRSRCRRHSAKPCHPRAAVTRGAPHGRCALSPVVPSLRPSLTPSVRARPRRGARATPVELRPSRGSPTPPLRGARRRDASEPARPQGQRARERKRRAAGPRRGTERASHHRTRAMGARRARTRVGAPPARDEERLARYRCPPDAGLGVRGGRRAPARDEAAVGRVVHHLGRSAHHGCPQAARGGPASGGSGGRCVCVGGGVRRRGRTPPRALWRGGGGGTP